LENKEETCKKKRNRNLVSVLFLQQKGSRNGTLVAVLKASGQPAARLQATYIFIFPTVERFSKGKSSVKIHPSWIAKDFISSLLNDQEAK
jgi:hypothetical protein